MPFLQFCDERVPQRPPALHYHVATKSDSGLQSDGNIYTVISKTSLLIAAPCGLHSGHVDKLLLPLHLRSGCVETVSRSIESQNSSWVLHVAPWYITGRASGLFLLVRFPIQRYYIRSWHKFGKNIAKGRKRISPRQSAIAFHWGKLSLLWDQPRSRWPGSRWPRQRTNEAQVLYSKITTFMS